MWQLFERNRGGLRVVATAAEILGYTEENCLPAPLQLLDEADRRQLSLFIEQWQLR